MVSSFLFFNIFVARESVCPRKQKEGGGRKFCAVEACEDGLVCSDSSPLSKSFQERFVSGGMQKLATVPPGSAEKLANWETAMISVFSSFKSSAEDRSSALHTFHLLGSKESTVLRVAFTDRNVESFCSRVLLTAFEKP